MLLRRFRIGDYIEIGNTRGQVQSIDLTMTVLRTLEDARVVEITLRPRCKAEDFWHVQFEVYRALLARFRERQIEIPYPQREVRLLSVAS